MADRDELIAVARECLADGFEPKLVVGADVGLAMLAVREPAESSRFDLGELLVTRTDLGNLGERGWTARMGGDDEAALAAAICEAEVEAEGPCADSVLELLCRTEARLHGEPASPSPGAERSTSRLRYQRRPRGDAGPRRSREAPDTSGSSARGGP
jgi:alpha-D-ribose 1-methylphosphonate 5-triphosphate synthase subunit PhnG